MLSLGGYKGSGLAMMIEILAGVLGGAEYFGTRVSGIRDKTRGVYQNYAFLAIHVDRFLPREEFREAHEVARARSKELDSGTRVRRGADRRRSRVAHCGRPAAQRRAGISWRMANGGGDGRPSFGYCTAATADSESTCASALSCRLMPKSHFQIS